MEEYREQQLKLIKEKFATDEGANDADYDPYNYRSVPNGTNYFETLVHVVKASLGTGLLAMPIAFKMAGIVNGLFLTGIVGAVCTYGIHLVVFNQYLLCTRLKVPYISYPALMRAAAAYGPNQLTYCGGFLEVMVELFIMIFHTGICIVYIIFVSENMKTIIDDTMGYKTSIVIYMLCMFIPFLCLLMPPNLKVMAPFSLISNLILFAIFLAIIYYLFDGLESITERNMFGDFVDIPLSLGTILFAIAAIGAVTTIERNMKNPKSFDNPPCGILNLAMALILSLYISMGFMGYWRYGEKVKGSVTLNLPEHSHIVKIIQGLAALSVFLSYGLNAYVTVEIIWLHLENKYEISHPIFYNYLMRFIYVIFTHIMAATMPLLDLFISLSGALCMSIIQVIFPALIDICMCCPSNFGRFYWSLWINIIVMIIGFIALCSGTYSSIRDIVIALQKKE